MRPLRLPRVSLLVLASWGLALVMTVIWAMLGVDRAEAQEQDQDEGEIFDFGISVSDEPLTVGDSIEFTNTGDRPHTATDRGNTFDTNAILPGESGSVTFDVPGTYEIFCRINPGQMNATVVVEEGPEQPDEVRVQTFDPAREGETLRFDPDELEVERGTQLTVANVGGASHTLTAEDGSFDTGTIEPGAEEGRFAGDNASFVADEPGTFNFFCQVHPDAMRGTLTVVGDAPEPEPEPPPDEEAEPGGDAVAAIALNTGDFFFDPVEVEVEPGAELTWTNTGDASHTATFDDVEGRVEGFDTGTIEPGDSGSLTAPDAPGSYSYFCAIHPGQMRAVLVVAASAAAEDVTEAEVAAESDDVVEPEAEEVAAEPPPDDGDFSPAALVVAVAIVLAGGGAIAIVLFSRRRPEGTD